MFKEGFGSWECKEQKDEIGGLKDKLQDSCQEQIYKDLTDTRLLPGVLAAGTDGLLQVSASSVTPKCIVYRSYLHRLSVVLASSIDRAIVIRQSGDYLPPNRVSATEMPGLSIAKPWSGGVQPRHFG